MDYFYKLINGWNLVKTYKLMNLYKFITTRLITSCTPTFNADKNENCSSNSQQELSQVVIYANYISKGR